MLRTCGLCLRAQGEPHALTTGLRAQSKLLNTQVVCPASGTCDTVLTSGYADVFGVPLSLFGALPLVPFASLCGIYTTESAPAVQVSPRPVCDRAGMLGYGAVAALAVREFLARTSRRRRSHRQALCSPGSGDCGVAHLQLSWKHGCNVHA